MPTALGTCSNHVDIHTFRNDPDPCIGWRDYPVGVNFSREQIEAWVGFALTDDQIEQLEEAAPNSSIPQAFEAIATEGLGFSEPDGTPDEQWQVTTPPDVDLTDDSPAYDPYAGEKHRYYEEN